MEQIFYDLFWQHKAIQNLFLLSKEEFLDTKVFIIGDTPKSISFPRIILSNIQSKEDYNHSKIKLRTEKQTQLSESLINQIFENYKPIITEFLESRFSGIAERIIADINEDLTGFIVTVVAVFSSGEKAIEEFVMNFLHHYNIVGRHITSLKQLEKYLEKEAFGKNIKTILTEQNFWALMELLKALKDRYVTEVYKSLHNSNQVLVSAFHDIDNFADRLKLFSMLYEAEIIGPSKEDAFIECTHCSTSTYRGVFSLNINPLKLKNIKCPICNTGVAFYVPYELNSVIYKLVKTKDGILLKVLEDFLKRKNIRYNTNITTLDDIEIDCLYQIKEEFYFVECKMYKQNTELRKLKSKLKKHYSKLIKDIERIQASDKPVESVTPILLVNINQPPLLKEILNELKSKNKRNSLYQNGRICTITEIPIK